MILEGELPRPKSNQEKQKLICCPLMSEDLIVIVYLSESSEHLRIVVLGKIRPLGIKWSHPCISVRDVEMCECIDAQGKTGRVALLSAPTRLASSTKESARTLVFVSICSFVASCRGNGVRQRRPDEACGCPAILFYTAFKRACVHALSTLVLVY